MLFFSCNLFKEFSQRLFFNSSPLQVQIRSHPCCLFDFIYSFLMLVCLYLQRTAINSMFICFAETSKERCKKGYGSAVFFEPQIFEHCLKEKQRNVILTTSFF